MASIQCPCCKNHLTDFSIDVVANGGELFGAGGIVFPACCRLIPNREICSLVRGVPTVHDLCIGHFPKPSPQRIMELEQKRMSAALISGFVVAGLLLLCIWLGPVSDWATWLNVTLTVLAILASVFVAFMVHDRV